MLSTPWRANVFEYLFHQNLNTGPYVRLCTADPGDSGRMTNEVTGGGYRSVSVYDRLVYDEGAGTATNDRPIYFVDMPAATVTHWAICQFGSGTLDEDVIVLDTFPTPVTVAIGKTLNVAPGVVAITIT
jgi:hypothetical protein